jgi:hypothetical protein
MFNLSWVNSPLLAAKNLKLQWKPSVCEQNIFHTPSACGGEILIEAITLAKKQAVNWTYEGCGLVCYPS